MLVPLMFMLVLAAAGRSESEYSFTEPGAPLRRRFELIEQRPHVILTCTSSTVIGQLEYGLMSESDTAHQRTVYRLTEGADSSNGADGPCPTLRRCLTHRACAFRFSNEFCGRDPQPGRRKKMFAVVICVEDSKHPNAAVVHLQYRSLLEEAGVRNYTAVTVVERLQSPELVFGLTCPQDQQTVTAAGYRGSCPGPVAELDRLRDRAGFILATTHSGRCREQLRQVLCSLALSRSAECLPPFVWSGTSGTSDTSGTSSELSETVTPRVGTRPAQPTPPANPRHLPLIPVRIGFYILVHDGLEAVLELLSLLYDPAHLYVLHVDRRSDALHGQLAAALSLRYSGRDNVRLLPTSRSHATDWGSDKIVSAELECLEELLRMGAWDFAVPLSGRDLPLRSVSDLALTLAPHRGRNLLHPGERKFAKPHEQHRVYAMYGCDGFIFNVSRPGDGRLELKIPIYGHSMWKALDRRFTEYLISELPCSPLARWTLLLRLLIVPDESFFATVLMNSPYRHTLLRTKLHHPKRFEGENSDRLCRHQDVAEFCGKGPATIQEGDIDHLQKQAGRFFFARKFSPEMGDAARQRYRDVFSRPYQQTVRHVLAPWLERYMVKISLQWMQLWSQVREDEVSWRDIKIVPRLEPISDCCAVLHRRENAAAVTYAYIVEFSVRGRWYRSRLHVAAPLACFPGALRSVRVLSVPPLDAQWFGARLNSPVPYLRAGTARLLLELWFHRPERGVTEQDTDCVSQTRGDTITVPEQGLSDGNTSLRVELWDGDTLSCSHLEVIQWSDPSSEPPPPSGRQSKQQEFSRVVNVTLNCGPIGPGQRTLRLYDASAADPYVYEVPLLFVSWHYEPAAEENTGDFWTVEDAALLDQLTAGGASDPDTRTTRSGPDEL